jgi:hypothetical protein
LIYLQSESEDLNVPKLSFDSPHMKADGVHVCARGAIDREGAGELGAILKPYLRPPCQITIDLLYATIGADGIKALNRIRNDYPRCIIALVNADPSILQLDVSKLQVKLR